MNDRRLIQMTILAMAIAPMSEMITISAIVNIYADFPGANTFVRAFILSGPMVLSIAAALVCGKLVQYVSKKDLLIIAYLIYLIAGVGAGLVTDINSLAVMRGLVGICYGTFSAAAFGLIAELFPDEDARAAMIGRVNAAFALSAVVFAGLGGYISTYNWHRAFLLNAIGLPIVLMIVYFLPRTPPERVTGAGGLPVPVQKLPYARVLSLCVAAFVFNLLYMILYYHVAVYVAERGLGDPTIAGIVTAVLTVGSFIAGIMFSFAYRVFGRFMPVLFFLGVAVCFFALSLKINVYWAGAIILCSGWAYGLSYAYYCLKSTTIVPAGVVSLSAGLVVSCINVATYLCPFALSAYEKAFNVDTIAGAFPYVATSLAIGGIISAILALHRKDAKRADGAESSASTSVPPRSAC
jgi:MFS family permease